MTSGFNSMLSFLRRAVKHGTLLTSNDNSFVYSFIHPSTIRPTIHLSNHSFIHLFVHSFTNSFFHSFIRQFILSSINSHVLSLLQIHFSCSVSTGLRCCRRWTWVRLIPPTVSAPETYSSVISETRTTTPKVICLINKDTLQWRYNERDGVSNHQPQQLFTHLFIQGADKRKHQSSASLALMRRIHRWPVNSPHKGPVTRKMFPFDDIIMSIVLSAKVAYPGDVSL